MEITSIYWLLEAVASYALLGLYGIGTTLLSPAAEQDVRLCLFLSWSPSEPTAGGSSGCPPHLWDGWVPSWDPSHALGTMRRRVSNRSEVYLLFYSGHIYFIRGKFVLTSNTT